MNSRDWAHVMCIFQLPAITGLRTPYFPWNLGANLRPGRVFALQNGLLPSKHNPISRGKLASSPGFHASIDLHLTHLNALFGFTTGGDPTLPFQELIQLHRREF